MKQSLAVSLLLALIAALISTFSIAQANPSPSVLETPATETATATATASPTTPPCDTRPLAPNLTKPKNKATVNGSTVTLHWNASECAKKYRIVVRRGAKKGALVLATRIKKLQLVTPPLARGYTYYWYVKACAQLCSRSKTWTFKLPPPPTPKPPPGTPPPPPPNGTPVPGVPPGNLYNYHGSSVYLNNNPNERWWSDCSRTWRPYGGTIYTTALWFYPAERVLLQVQDFNLGQVFIQQKYVANSQGYLELASDTSSWTTEHHYHFIFKGESSGVEYCGHFDLPLPGGAPAPLEHEPHSPAELKAGRFLNEP